MGQVFARSPQAKGRVERAAGTFQDRLLSELRLAGAATMEEANRVLQDFLPRYDERFGVPAAQPGSAYRPVPLELNLEEILCFKYRRKAARDNTVQFRWRTLQLLPPRDRTSYAGATGEVRQQLDGILSVVHQGRTIPTREAPPRRSALREATTCQAYHTTNNATQFMKRIGACLPGTEDCPASAMGQDRRPTPRMQAYWEVVQEAKSRGLSLRAIARELGISRNTVTKYARANRPPAYGDGAREQEQQSRQLIESLVSSP